MGNLKDIHFHVKENRKIELIKIISLSQFPNKQSQKGKGVEIGK